MMKIRKRWNKRSNMLLVKKKEVNDRARDTQSEKVKVDQRRPAIIIEICAPNVNLFNVSSAYVFLKRGCCLCGCYQAHWSSLLFSTSFSLSNTVIYSPLAYRLVICKLPESFSPSAYFFVSL